MATATPETVTPEQGSVPRSPVAVERAPGRWITHWDPEDEAFWEGGGRAIARRNLIFSILAEHLGFSVWVMWSIVTVNLNAVGFAFTEASSSGWSRSRAWSARPCGCPTRSRCRGSAVATGPSSPRCSW